MKIQNVEVKGNGERVVIQGNDGIFREGRLFFVKPQTWDLLTDDGVGHRYNDASIRQFSRRNEN